MKALPPAPTASTRLTTSLDHEKERKKDLEAIVGSTHNRRVVVAGPGTGKSYLFQAVIKEARKAGKKKFLAITFIGKLCDALADDLAGLAETRTLHGFARQFVLGKWKKSEYYPRMRELIEEDLAMTGCVGNVGSEEYKKRTEYYRAVGDDDVVHYALQICKKDAGMIPTFDLILVDEFQDFNECESAFIDLLATKNRVLIVGDDDQALYEFKGSSPRFIREKHDVENGNYESHSLRFCSRCTEAIIGVFHNIVDHYKLNGEGSARIRKDYLCYLPEKRSDSETNPRVVISRNTQVNKIPFVIKEELAKLLESQKIKSVLIIGEAQSCASQLANIAKKLRHFGFKNIDHKQTASQAFSFKQAVVDAYKLLHKNEDSRLGWRLLLGLLSEEDRSKLLREKCEAGVEFGDALAAKFKKEHIRNAGVLAKILNGTPSEVKNIADSSIEKLSQQIVSEARTSRELLVHQLSEENQTLTRPLGNLEVTICNILGSKGLGADVVFVVGFDEGKLPAKAEKVKDSEIYQMLVALTRAKKRIYLVNTAKCKISRFIDCFDKAYYIDL
jgi:superfamily I DNA/RNA helicase